MTEKSLCLNPEDQKRVLAKLRELRDSGAELRPTSLARKLRIPEAYIAPTLQTLQRKGYIRSGDHPKTGLRVKYLSEFARLPDEPPPPTNPVKHIVRPQMIFSEVRLARGLHLLNGRNSQEK